MQRRVVNMQTGPTSKGGLLRPWGWVKNVKRNLPTLVRPSDYYQLLMFQVGRDVVAVGNLRAIKRLFRALG